MQFCLFVVCMIIWHVLFLKIAGFGGRGSMFLIPDKNITLTITLTKCLIEGSVSADRDPRPRSARWIKGSRNSLTTTMETMAAGHAKMPNSKVWSHSSIWWAGNIKFSVTVKKGEIEFLSPLVAVIYCILALDVLRFRHFLYWLQSVAKIQTGKSCRAWRWWKAAQRSEIKNKDWGLNQKKNKLLYSILVQLFHLG